MLQQCLIVMNVGDVYIILKCLCQIVRTIIATNEKLFSLEFATTRISLLLKLYLFGVVMYLRSSASDGKFHKTIARVLILGNFLGFPINGIFSNNVSELRFSWKSFQALYSLYLLSMSIFNLICYIFWMIKPSLSKYVSIVDLVINVLSLLSFQQLAQKWPELMRKWANVEDTLPLVKDFGERNLLRNRITMIQILILTISAGENRTFSFYLSLTN